MKWIIRDRVVNFVILANALAVFVLAALPPQSVALVALRNVDVACVAYFVAEVALKIRYQGWSEYARSGWNRFDFLVTIASLPVLASPLITLTGWEAIILLRMARLFRLFRVLRFVPDVDRLVVGLTRATKAAFGLLLAILLLNTIFSLGATLLFGRFAPGEFGDPFASMYTMFRVFTMDGWSEIPAMIARNADSPAWGIIAKGYFIGVVVVGGILGMGLANAVLVDEMLADDSEELRQLISEVHDEVRHLRRELAVVDSASEDPCSRPHGPSEL